MKRRLDLAAALIHNPQILFLDEPTTGLDPISRTRVWEEVQRVNSDLGVTIFLTTQYLEEADELADRVGIINRGKLMAEGTPGRPGSARSATTSSSPRSMDTRNRPARPSPAFPGVAGVETRGSEVLIQVSNGAAAISSVALALNERSVDVSEIILRTPTLDDVFLSVAGARMEEEAESEDEAATSASRSS